MKKFLTVLVLFICSAAFAQDTTSTKTSGATDLASECRVALRAMSSPRDTAGAGFSKDEVYSVGHCQGTVEAWAIALVVMNKIVVPKDFIVRDAVNLVELYALAHQEELPKMTGEELVILSLRQKYDAPEKTATLDNN